MAKVHHLNITLVSGNVLSLDFAVHQNGQVTQTVFDEPFTIQEKDGQTGIHIDPEHYESYAPVVEAFWDVEIPEGEAAFFPISSETAQQIQDFVSKLG
ncbi:hypothetical protein BWI97_15630 [Siphonobacter sp. BAB-5405]|uniref:hypothetical protein n=1 Tax=Siphonobacter sp. BAB-5405 TaxID=1864825 RepID=UPI000C80DDA4|nr:hypothetical protein [Siphonobacter sp. BAB-5405]PMD94827.1 hypothetical protein BWI97_15630 [Siphonobacter sp. BAB-5405]